MIYPEKLKKNDLIEIISPSNGVKNNQLEKYENGLKKLINYGFRIVEDKYVRESIKGASSTAINRAKELNSAITNKDVKALIACSGGDYIVQILDLINFEQIVQNVKWLQGHSDITALLFYITTKYDIATIYSFNAKSFGNKSLPEIMIKNNINFIKGKNPIQMEFGYKIKEKKINKPWKYIKNDDVIEGRIIGGCLDSLKDIIGTKYDNVKNFIEKYKSNGIVWYFDVAELTNEDILRTMWQLKSAGWFKDCRGILFGRIENEISYTNISLADAINYNFKDFNIPIIMNVDIGHTAPVFTIINGSKVKISKSEIDNKHILETMFE
jgi:muramoyltetrapeptide carboxypeptidase LdcA involved in peptidoglycan recycling